MKALLLAVFVTSAALGQDIGSYSAPPAATGVPTTRTVGTGTATSTGLSGGGALSGDLSLTCTAASGSSAGCVTVSAQTWAGNKTLTGLLTGSAGLQFTGDISSLTTSGAGLQGGTVSGLPGLWLLGGSATPSTSNYVLLSFGGVALNSQTGTSAFIRTNNTNDFGCDGTTCTAYNALAIGSSGTAISASYANTATIDFAATTNTTTDSSAITVTGAAVGAPCAVGVPTAAQVTGASFTCIVTATNNVKVRFQAQGTSIDPASGTFAVRVFNP